MLSDPHQSFFFQDALPLFAKDKIYKLEGQGGGFTGKGEDKGPGQGILIALDGRQGGLDRVDGQGFDLMVDNTKGDVADGLRVIGDNFPDRTIGVLDQGFIGNFPFLHNQGFEGISGPGAFFAIDEIDRFIHPAQP